MSYKNLFLSIYLFFSILPLYCFGKEIPISLGVRPFFLIETMKDSPLKNKLKQCEKGPFYKSDFSIGHRGAPLQFPEHTKESYLAAAKMGAGILECDVTFTKDKELVCRHSQCDLHSTTNILLKPSLAKKCKQSFKPAKFDEKTGELTSPASAKCCTNDITLSEFKQLKGKMDAVNKNATTIEKYVNATPSFRTDLYATYGTLLTHKESIQLFKKLNVKMIPELKSPEVKMPYMEHYTQNNYAQQMIDEYKEAEVDSKQVFPQSFNLSDIMYWTKNEPKFGNQAVYLDDRYDDPNFKNNDSKTWKPSMKELYQANVKIIAPPIWVLLNTKNGKIIPSTYALEAKKAGLKIVAWSFERSGPLNNGGGWYYQTIQHLINNDSQMIEVLDILSQKVGVMAVFSDWPAIITFYANCKKL